MEVLPTPDIEAAAVAYLKAKLADVAGLKVGTRRPWATDWQDAHPPIVRVQAVGGGEPRDIVLDDSRLTVEVWHTDSVAAAVLAGQVFAHLNAWAGVWSSVLVYRGFTTRPASVPDPLTQSPRYVMTVSVTARLLNT